MWNESGELCCIGTDESFFMLRFSPADVEKAKEQPDLITEDGIEDAFEVCNHFSETCQKLDGMRIIL